MTFALTFAAIRRHPFGVLLAGMVAWITSALLGAPTAVALGGWLIGAMVVFEVWFLVEPTLLRWFGGCRRPSHAERERVEAVLGRTDLCLLVADACELAAARGLRCLVLGRDVLDLFEDRALSGYLVQVAAPVQAADRAGFVLVWLGSLPVMAAWLATRFIGQLARLLAVAVGNSLVVPLVLWRDGFLRWSGRLFASAMVALIGAELIVHGLAATGLLLLIAWLVTPTLRALLAWESQRVERAADTWTIAAGYGPQLLEAADLLAVAGPANGSRGLVGLLCPRGAPMVERATRIRMAVNGSAITA